jgi:hypothetical protein
VVNIVCILVSLRLVEKHICIALIPRGEFCVSFAAVDTSILDVSSLRSSMAFLPEFLGVAATGYRITQST